MPVDYNPKDAVQVWAAGEYPATLTKVEDKISKVKPDGTGGNPMQVWTFRAFNDDREQLIFEYVVIPASVFKIRQLADALGRHADFDAGTFQADDYIGADVLLDLMIDQQPGYDDKNKVKKIKAAGVPSGAVPQPPMSRQAAREPATSPISSNKQFEEADIPF